MCGRQLLTHLASPGIEGAGASAVGGRCRGARTSGSGPAAEGEAVVARAAAGPYIDVESHTCSATSRSAGETAALATAAWFGAGTGVGSDDVGDACCEAEWDGGRVEAWLEGCEVGGYEECDVEGAAGEEDARDAEALREAVLRRRSASACRRRSSVCSSSRSSRSELSGRSAGLLVGTRGRASSGLRVAVDVGWSARDALGAG